MPHNNLFIPLTGFSRKLVNPLTGFSWKLCGETLYVGRPSDADAVE
jgi:hypothetical protein